MPAPLAAAAYSLFRPGQEHQSHVCLLCVGQPLHHAQTAGPSGGIIYPQRPRTGHFGENKAKSNSSQAYGEVKFRTAKTCYHMLGFDERSLAVIRRSGRQLHFVVCLIQQIFSSISMTAQVKLVRPLRFGDFADGLFDETLRGVQIRMPVRIDVLPDDYAGSEKSQTQDGAQYQFANFHGKNLWGERTTLR